MIPLPVGYTEEQCRWFVAPYNHTYSFGQGGAHGYNVTWETHCYTVGRKVYVGGYHNASGENNETGLANYILIAGITN